MRWNGVLLASLLALLLAACGTGGYGPSGYGWNGYDRYGYYDDYDDGYGYPSSAFRSECQDPDWFGLSACSCGRCDRGDDDFDLSNRRHERDHDHDRPDGGGPMHRDNNQPPPFAGKDN